METPTPNAPADAEPGPPKDAVTERTTPTASPASTRLPSIVVGVIVAAVAGLSIWYLVRGEPLLVQGEVDATRLDIAARVDGRVDEIPDQNAKIASRLSNENTGRLDTVTPS